MIQLLAKNWWGLEIRGILTIIFGGLVLFLPTVTLAVLVLLFGAYAFIEGIVLLAMSAGPQYANHRWITALQGIAGVAAGVFTFFWPAITATLLLLVIAAWAIVTGILEIMAAVRLQKEIRGEWLLVASGVLSLIFAFVLLFNPVAGALALVWVIGIYAIMFGVISVALGLKMRRMEHA